MEIKEQLIANLHQSVKKLTNLDLDPIVELSSDLSKGDFSTNIAMIAFAKLRNRDPEGKTYDSAMALGEKIVENIKKDKLLYERFKKIELIKPGFINFYLSQVEISAKLFKVLKMSGKIDESTKSSNEIIFEFGDPNPFKEPHIGHLRIFAVGEVLARLSENTGKKVIRANYQGDVGLHVAKAIWGIINLSFDIENITPKQLGNAYSHGATNYESNEKIKEEIHEINKKIYLKNPEIMKIWEKGRRVSLDYFETLYKKMGISYDKYYFESITAEKGKEIVEKYLGKVFEKDSGAVIFRGDKFGLHTRVFLTKDGHATYEGKDLALAITKHEDFPNASSIIITANEQVEYFKVLIKALGEIDKKISEKTKHLSVGFVNLKEGKMSSRSGNIVSAFWLIEEIRKRIKEGFKEVSEEVLDQLSVGAVKWGMLQFSRDSNISFSIEESVRIEGNSGPYMQYTYARAKSILTKKDISGIEAKSAGVLSDQELALARYICQFPYLLENAKNTFSPNILTDYLFRLAQSFNAFYEKEKVIGSDRENEKLVLVKGAAIVIKKGLGLLGIDAPEKI